MLLQPAHKTLIEQDEDRILSEFTPQTDDVQETSLPISSTDQNKKVTKLKTWHKVALTVFGIFIVLGTILGVLAYKTYTVAQEMKIKAAEAELIGRDAYASFKAQNLPAVKSKIDELDTKLQSIESDYAQLSFYQKIPIANNYYADGLHGLAAAKAGLAAGKRSIDAITPYADVLGFTGEGTFQGGTAEDRLKLILQTLQKITPQLDAITADLTTVEKELSAIDAERYPEEFKGQKIKSRILEAQGFSTAAVTAMTEYRPVIEQLPAMAGATGKRRKYLVLFQNDNELRPTGGFLTAFAVINVENGKVTPEKSDDIYELDKKFKKKLPIPEALGKYLTTEKVWHLRDMNIYPDFKTSMDKFYSEYINMPGEPSDIDGIIAVDTEFLKTLVSIVGPIEVPGYGKFSAENEPKCNCPQIIYALSEIITRPTPYIREDRKGILGPLMRELLTKSYGAPKQQWPQLFGEAFTALQGRHIQLYFVDTSAQKAAEVMHAAGRLLPSDTQMDFFALVNANLGGAKSNLFTNYSMTQTVSAPVNGIIEKTVEITYVNSRKGDNCNLEAGLLCLNSTLRDWTRIYVPEGSKLISSQGFTTEAKTYDEAGFTVIDGFFILEPNATAKLKVTYQVPYDDSNEYRLQIWKQGGILKYDALMDVTGGQEKVEVTKDTVYKTTF
ncbi:DUF4012 domain-containing protein [Candidatus Woesebacteria bacterium]|nr:DUF4012 domain-containing protein [Candidatus Woesebacteria bacterium]